MLRIISSLTIFVGFFVYSFTNPTPFRISLAVVVLSAAVLGEVYE